jgi:predicted nucleic acid-binding protein
MEWIGLLRGKVVGLDTTPIIYFIERNPPYVDMIRSFIQAMDRGEFSVVTSMVTLLETLVVPLRQRNVDLANQYRTVLLRNKSLKTIPLSLAIAEEAAELRAFHNIRTPDAIQMATAINEKASFFLTNDKKFPSTSKIKVLVLDDLRE